MNVVHLVRCIFSHKLCIAVDALNYYEESETCIVMGQTCYIYSLRTVISLIGADMLQNLDVRTFTCAEISTSTVSSHFF